MPTNSYPRGAVCASIAELVPPLVAEPQLMHGLPIMDRRWHGRFLRDSTLVGPEARGSAPVRIVRDDSRQTPGMAGLYPVGEGAGYAGGIVSAAVDGLRTARAVIAPLLAGVSVKRGKGRRGGEICPLGGMLRRRKRAPWVSRRGMQASRSFSRSDRTARETLSTDRSRSVPDHLRSTLPLSARRSTSR